MWRALLFAAVLAGCVRPSDHCRETCDGCCKGAVCVPLAETTGDQCGWGGQQCLSSCAVCDQGMCSTGSECFIRRPAVCECGSEGNAQCGYDCGACPAGRTCSNNRCVL